MDSDPHLPQLVEDVLRSHREEVVELLEAWMSRLNVLLGGGLTPASALKSEESRSRIGEPQSPYMQEMSADVSQAVLKEASPKFNADSRAPEAAAKAGQPRGHQNSKDELDESTDRIDSRYLQARQTEHRISQALNKLGSFSIHVRKNAGSGRALTWEDVRERTKAVMSSQKSNVFWALVILTNSVYLGVHLEWSVDHRGSGSTVNSTFFYLHLVYALLFTLEVALRLIGWGFWALLCGKDWYWNWLDLFVVISSWAEFVGDVASAEESDVSRGNSNFRLMRLLRLGRLVRVVRIVRVVRLFRALRTLVASLAGTLKSLFWSFLLLGLLVYIFAILFTDVVLDHVIEYNIPRSNDDMMQVYFGDLYLASTTLFRSISNGLSWHQAADSLAPAGEIWVQAFNFYVAFCSFAVLNVMTGVFCNSAIKAAENDHDLAVQSLVQTRKELQEQVVQLFSAIDKRGRGQLTISEFERHFADDAVKAFFEVLKIGAVDAWTLFTSLDKDGDHTVSVDEFVERCLQLHGPARSADLFAMRLQNAKYGKQLRKIDEAQQRLSQQLTQIGSAAVPLPQTCPTWL